MEMFKTLFAAGSLAVLSAVTVTAQAQPAMDHSKVGDMKPAEGPSAAMSDAEVRKVDKEQGKVTLKHGPIANLDMPGMTMVFSVKDKSLLDNVGAGDKVRFKAVNDNGKLVVSEIQAAK